MTTRWENVIGEMNPSNVPRTGLARNQGWMPLEPATGDQLDRLRRGIALTGANAALLFGDGFRSLDLLSKWSASWAISLCDEFLEAHPEVAKRAIADMYLTTYPGLRRVSCDD